MGPEEILREAHDKAKNYPRDRLSLTGSEWVAAYEHAFNAGFDAGIKALAESIEAIRLSPKR